MADLSKLSPPKHLTEDDRETIFQHFFCKLAVHRNTAELYALTEYGLSSYPEPQRARRKDSLTREVNRWAQSLLEKAWAVCEEPGGGIQIFNFHVPGWM